MNYILILGAKSDIAMEIARSYAQKGFGLFLAARGVDEELSKSTADMAIRNNVEVRVLPFDALAYKTHKTFYQELNPKPIGVILAVGYLGDQKKGEQDFDEVQRIIESNYSGCVSILNIIANDFEQRKKGFIVGISSVAGERGRQSNYLYASAKAAFTAYLSGLRNRLQKSNVQVLTVNPGFVYTKMTSDLDLPGLITAQPAEVARDIIKAQQKGKDVIYTKWFWKYIMLMIRIIPERIFKKMGL
jgi:short-subunit dehydrogenase